VSITESDQTGPAALPRRDSPDLRELQHSLRPRTASTTFEESGAHRESGSYSSPFLFFSTFSGPRIAVSSCSCR
jgi:hypothetical protein